MFQLATGDTPAATQPGLHHTAWQLESFKALQEAYRELNQLGVAVESTVEHNVTRSVYFHDPDGNRVELYCDMVPNDFEFMQARGPVRIPLDMETGETVSQ